MSYYDIQITGKDTKRFIHNLHKMHIEMLNIVFNDKSVTIKVSEQDYKKILDIKTIYEIKVVKLYGIAYIKDFLKKHLVFFLILILGFCFFLTLINIIFDIEVVHDNKEIRDLLLEELESNGIKKYNFVISYEKKEEIKEEILKKYKDKLEWIEIERQGTKYIVKVEERKKNTETTNDTPQNIIAKKNGLVKQILSSSGEIIVKKDQYVKKGDILISGIIHNKEKEVARIKAEGTVKAETWYTVTVELPFHYREESETKNNQKLISLKLFNKNIKLFDFDKYKDKKEKVIFSLKNNIIPISLSLVEEHELEVIDKIYTKDNAITEATSIAKKQLKDKLGENIEIIYEKNLKLTEEDSKIIVVMFYKIYEDITDYQEISEIAPIEENEVES